MNLNKKTEKDEAISLREILVKGKKQSFSERVKTFSSFMSALNNNQHNLYMRQVLSPADREVTILDPFSNQRKKMLMFGSNNYLGLANHPYVKEQVAQAISDFGTGIGGPPLLNGYSKLYRELEDRLAHLKKSESCLLFSSGYAANVGLLTALINREDKILYDELSHASFYDGLRMAKCNAESFKHNNVIDLQTLLYQNNAIINDVFVGVEGVYSMDGDLAPLDEIVSVCKKRNAILILDDAHGTGVLGDKGHGTAEHFGVEDNIDITMGTFSKTFAMSGGFVTASKDIVEYLRYFARSHMFSASLPPVVIKAVLAGLDVIENEPQLISSLRKNIGYTSKKLKQIGFDINTHSPIIALHVPQDINVREAAFQFHSAGIFVNSIEYPAVPENQQRFRISLMASHTQKDIDHLLAVIEEIWSHAEQKLERKAS